MFNERGISASKILFSFKAGHEPCVHNGTHFKRTLYVKCYSYFVSTNHFCCHSVLSCLFQILLCKGGSISLSCESYNVRCIINIIEALLCVHFHILVACLSLHY